MSTIETVSFVKQCQKCGLRDGTEIWTGEGGTMAYIHGNYQKWCEQCCVVEQIRYCEEAAARLPELRLRLLAMTLT